jgi:carboxyl-terminal processing protease
MTIAQFFRIDGGSTQLRGVAPDISFPLTVDAADFGESSYDNALPWTSIAPARYHPVADLKPILPMLLERHQERTRDNVEWKNLEADLAELRKLRGETTVSLNEDVRRKERDAQEAKRKARDLAAGSATPEADPATKTREKINADAERRLGKSDAPTVDKAVAPADAALRDDGLQPDERSIRTDIAREEKAKDRRDVVLDETAHILADEISLIRSDTKLAAQVLPRGVVVPAEVD